MPSTKLTLNIKTHVIDQAKAYANRQHVSLSKIVENYLSSLTDREEKTTEVSPWTKELTAVKKPTPDFDHKSDYRDAILDKYNP
ncbi:DUF6364 family protein [Parapedobacter soli]|uniref:DUF6364 family protein n=1 Tax=Parapedobacter soli TaxID=416955 RepID=UPI0021C95059|nr:DUF6364 family protein [Parapedobacter soli]